MEKLTCYDDIVFDQARGSMFERVYTRQKYQVWFLSLTGSATIDQGK